MDIHIKTTLQADKGIWILKKSDSIPFEANTYIHSSKTRSKASKQRWFITKSHNRLNSADQLRPSKTI